jgi:hypothetical protein
MHKTLEFIAILYDTYARLLREFRRFPTGLIDNFRNNHCFVDSALIWQLRLGYVRLKLLSADSFGVPRTPTNSQKNLSRGFSLEKKKICYPCIIIVYKVSKIFVIVPAAIYPYHEHNIIVIASERFSSINIIVVRTLNATLCSF